MCTRTKLTHSTYHELPCASPPPNLACSSLINNFSVSIQFVRQIFYYKSHVICEMLTNLYQLYMHSYLATLSVRSLPACVCICMPLNTLSCASHYYDHNRARLVNTIIFFSFHSQYETTQRTKKKTIEDLQKLCDENGKIEKCVFFLAYVRYTKHIEIHAASEIINPDTERRLQIVISTFNLDDWCCLSSSLLSSNWNANARSLPSTC